ncbi:hypothetical protein QH494_28010 [Sphingomonas sp. AR_OL41]|uniref:hypothetical protein n=1 Tax=Sphingomonas sp. AR_OL41 TaxID=3042729 RepID=UPI0024807AAD|nr:hypothetical protein [Sphingomonas sp. AR_OL41]MDH7976041.1 hypothetical protein [Sphingomonas sp. AR_OL41]
MLGFVGSVWPEKVRMLAGAGMNIETIRFWGMILLGVGALYFALLWILKPGATAAVAPLAVTAGRDSSVGNQGHIGDNHFHITPTNVKLTHDQTDLLGEINLFICVKDELSLRQTFSLPEMLEENVILAIQFLHLDTLNPLRIQRLNEFFENGQARIDLRYGTVEVREFGNHYEPKPGTFGMMNTTATYVAARGKLAAFINSAIVPINVRNALKEFDEQIEANTKLIIEVINDLIATSPSLLVNSWKEESNGYGAAASAYARKFITLRPFAEKIDGAIREYLNP